ERAADIDVHQRLEVGQINLGNRTGESDSRTVDQDVQSPQCFDRVVDGPPDRIGIGTVCLESDAAATERLDRRDDAVCALSRSLVGDRDVHAVLGQGLCDCGADAAGAAGDKGAFAFEV